MNGKRWWIFAWGISLGAGLPASSRAQNPLPGSPPSLLAEHAASALASPAPTPEAGVGANSPNSPNPPSLQIAVAGADYVLAPSDTVEMTIFHEPDLTTQTRIASDGSAQFPLIGELKIGGLAMRDARELIRRKYDADYLVEPQVYLNVVGYAARKFTILGQVAKPGAYDFPPGEHLTLLEAVGMAGGFTRLANESGVTIKRAAQGSEKTLKINARKLTAKNGKPFELSAGDVITVGESWF
jgi:protein involved in polysaccharide export with SLBB domain